MAGRTDNRGIGSCLCASVFTTDARIGDVPDKRFAVGLCGRNDDAFPEELSANVRKEDVSFADKAYFPRRAAERQIGIRLA